MHLHKIVVTWVYGLQWAGGNYDPALRFLYQKRNSRYPARQAAEAARKLIGRLISARQPYTGLTTAPVHSRNTA